MKLMAIVTTTEAIIIPNCFPLVLSSFSAHTVSAAKYLRKTLTFSCDFLNSGSLQVNTSNSKFKNEPAVFADGH